MKSGVLKAKPNIAEYTGSMSLNYHSRSLKGGVRSPNIPERDDNQADFARCAASHGGGGGGPWQRCASGLILFIKQNVIKTLPYAHLKRGRESSGVVRQF